MKRKFFSALLLMTLSVASVGMFVSCKDYDDDINGVRDDVTNLRSELTGTLTELQNELDQVTTDLDGRIAAAIEGKADQSYVDELNAQRIAAENRIQEQIDAINDALANLDAGEIQEAMETLAAVTGRVEGVENRIGVVEQSLQIQQAALQGFLEDIQNAGFENAEELIAAVTNAQSAISAI